MNSGQGSSEESYYDDEEEESEVEISKLSSYIGSRKS